MKKIILGIIFLTPFILSATAHAHTMTLREAVYQLKKLDGGGPAFSLLPVAGTVNTPAPIQTPPVMNPVFTANKNIVFTREIKAGFIGDDVKALQERLTNEGLYIGPLDGRFGPLTQEAVRKFQQKYKLSPVGVVGPQTLKILNL